ncbi:hypothetical protein RJ640_006249, partial [Escallonia rubra]
ADAFSKVVYTANKDKQYRVFKEEVRSLASEVAAKHLAKSSSPDQLLGFTASVVHFKTSDGYELMAKSVNLVSTFMYTDDASGRVMYESSACITAILSQVEHNLEHTRTKRWCNEIHVGPIGHPFKLCRGQNASIRKGHHEWADAVVEDILVQVEAYHLFDGLVIRIPHVERFSITRVPAVVELCIQAGVDLPEFPTKNKKKTQSFALQKVNSLMQMKVNYLTLSQNVQRHPY